MHSQYYNKDGIEVPSVTTILKILNKDDLLGWANYMGFKRIRVQDVQEQSSYFGTCIHDYLYSRLMGSVYINFFTSWCLRNDYEITQRNFEDGIMSKYNIEPIIMEEGFSTDTFGGTLDFYGLLDGEEYLIDFKTSKNVYETHKLQLGGYYHLLKQNGMAENLKGAAILLINVKMCRLKKFTIEELERFEKQFLLLTAFYIEYKKGV